MDGIHYLGHTEYCMELIRCCHPLYLWRFQRDFSLIESDDPCEEALLPVLLSPSEWEACYSPASRGRCPVIITDRAGLTWAVLMDDSQAPDACGFMLGPFAMDDLSIRKAFNYVRRTELPIRVQHACTERLKTIPVIAINRIYDYVFMLYYSLYGEQIAGDDIFFAARLADPAEPDAEPVMLDVHGTYEMERQMVQMVREGNLNYRALIDRIAMTGNQGVLSAGDGLRQTKNMVFVSIVLFSRAAIEGGLSPETSLTLTDYYFQAIEACTSLAQVNEVTRSMQDDFVRRVHDTRVSEYSRPVRECLDYMKLHVRENVELKTAAALLGYSESYLSHQFKKETGSRFKETLLRMKLAEGKEMLCDEMNSIRMISEKLHFCSASYFSEQFRNVYGISPTQYRKERKTQQ